MTVRRWATTAAAMAAVGWGLLLLAPAAPALVTALTAPQRTVDTAGPDALLVPVVWVLATACWAWGAVGLALTSLSARTGIVGRVSGGLLRVVLPAGLRRVSAVAVGVSLATVPVVATAAPPASTSVSAAPTADTASGGGTPLQKTAPAATNAPGWADLGEPGTTVVPDWPVLPAPGPEDHVVLRGDCLWDIAADWLATRTPGAVTPAATAAAVQSWWRANADVIGPDPDLIRPGQVLRAPLTP